MKRKLLSFIFSFSLLLASSPLGLINQTAYAATSPQIAFTGCPSLPDGLLTYDYSPFPLKWNTKSFTVTIHGANNLGSGAYKLLLARPLIEPTFPSGSGFGGYKVDIDNKNYNFNFTATPEEGIDNPYVRSIYIGLALADDVLSSGVCDPAVIDLVDPASSAPGTTTDSGSCNISVTGGPFTPRNTNVKIQAIDLSETDFPDDRKLGFLVENMRSSQDLKNTCITAGELRKGILLGTATGYSFDTGSYAIAVGAPFEFFGNCTLADDPKICNTDKPAYPNVKFEVTPEGGYPYADCTNAAAKEAAKIAKKTVNLSDIASIQRWFGNWDQSKPLDFCSNRSGAGPKSLGKAPYCVTDPFVPTKGVCVSTAGVGIACPNDKCDTALGPFSYVPTEFAKSVLTLILSLSGGIVLIFLIINGYKLMTSSGDPEKVKEARESIISAVSGLLFIIFSLVLLQFITINILQLPGFTR